MQEPDDPENITALLRAWSDGHRDAEAKLFHSIHRALRAMAARCLRRERQGHTLQATALVNEAYLRLIDQQAVHWQDRAHFFAIAAQAMRRILVDHARRQKAAKRPGAGEKVLLEDCGELGQLPGALDPAEILSLHHALEGLARRDAEQARLVELRFFAGLSGQELAQVLGMSTATVTREWRMARAWLAREMGPRDNDGGSAE